MFSGMPPRRRSTSPRSTGTQRPRRAPKRTYRLQQRAEAQAATRQRIVEAIVALHQEVGPAQTTITSIAERAGVERLTVYRHFPDELSQFIACSAHWSEMHPAPDPERWAAIGDAEQRLRAAIGDLYGFYRRGQPMLRMIMRDVPELPDLQKVVRPFEEYLKGVASLLLEPGKRHGRQQRAAVGHAIQFSTWQSLSQQGLGDAEAVDLMVRAVEAAASPQTQR
jgi:AcrR family transcriptional regulator